MAPLLSAIVASRGDNSRRQTDKSTTRPLAAAYHGLARDQATRSISLVGPSTAWRSPTYDAVPNPRARDQDTASRLELSNPCIPLCHCSPTIAPLVGCSSASE